MVSWPLVAHSLSRVIPSMSGIQMSNRTRSGRPRLRAARASLAFSASRTWWPSSRRISDNNSRIPISSSTTSIWLIVLTELHVRGKSLHLDPRLGERQQDADLGATAGNIGNLDTAVVLFDDLLDDRQTQTRPLGFGSYIRLE